MAALGLLEPLRDAAQANGGAGLESDATFLDTLAAAYAADGRFDVALDTAARAREIAARNDSAHAERIAARQRLYAEGRTYRGD
jgi:hypothetical protein